MRTNLVYHIFGRWLWIAKRIPSFGGYIIGFYRLFTIWIVKGGFEFTIAEPSYKPILFWWIKIDVTFYPFSIFVYNRNGIIYDSEDKLSRKIQSFFVVSEE